MDMDREIDSNTIIVGDFNTPWTSMNKSSDRKTTGKQESNSTLDQIDLINIQRVFYPKAAEYTFFSSAHGTFSRMYHMLGQKTNL